MPIGRSKHGVITPGAFVGWGMVVSSAVAICLNASSLMAAGLPVANVIDLAATPGSLLEQTGGLLLNQSGNDESAEVFVAVRAGDSRKSDTFDEEGYRMRSRTTAATAVR